MSLAVNYNGSRRTHTFEGTTRRDMNSVWGRKMATVWLGGRSAQAGQVLRFVMPKPAKPQDVSGRRAR